MHYRPDPATVSFRAARYQVSGPAPAQTPARRDVYKLWLLESAGILHHGQLVTTLEQPALIFLHPLVPYWFDSESPFRSGYWAVFSSEFMHQVHLPAATLFSSEQASMIQLPPEKLQRVAFIFQGIVEDYQSNYSNRYDSIRSAVQLLIHEGLKYRPAVLNSPTHETAAQRLTTQFLNLLETQFPIITLAQPLRLKKPAAFANQLAVHVNHLNAVVRQVTGKSTSAHIAERMISESRALLLFTDWTVSEIAYALGFDYPNHFTAFFKKHTHQTPLSLRT